MDDDLLVGIEPLCSFEDRSLDRKLLTDLRRKSLRNEGMMTAGAKVLALRCGALLQQGLRRQDFDKTGVASGSGAVTEVSERMACLRRGGEERKGGGDGRVRSG